MRSVSSALLLAKRQQHLEACLCCSLLEFSPRLRPGRKTKDFEKRNLCSCVPRLRIHVSVFWSHAKSSAVLGGTLGENAACCSCHGSSTQEDGCGLSPAAGPARHVVLCGHRTVFSSPPGRQNVSPPRIFFHEPSPLVLYSELGTAAARSNKRHHDEVHPPPTVDAAPLYEPNPRRQRCRSGSPRARRRARWAGGRWGSRRRAGSTART